jgi:hypothetical protein
MAVGRIELTAEIENLRELQTAIGRIFEPQDKAKIIKDALMKAIEPAYQRLVQLTPVGPTGNLKRAVAKKFVTYGRNGNAVALLGFKRAGERGAGSAAGGSVRAGPDRAFHQWWLEEGTQARQVNTLSNKPYTRRAHQRKMKSGTVAEISEHTVKGQGGYIASSFNRLGPFRMVKDPTQPSRVITDPQYQRAFFRKSKNPITIPAMPAGGTQGAPPLKTAWAQTQSTVAEILQRELRISLEAAVSTLSRSSTGIIG